MRRTACLLLAIAVAVALPACRRGQDGDGGTEALQGSTTSTTAVPEVKFTVAVAAVESMRHEPVAFPDATRAGVVAALDAWVGAGIVAPLLTGQPPVGLDAAFSPGALARLTPGSPDRASLLEDARPAEGGIESEKASVALVGLANQGGDVELVTASVDVSLLHVSPAGRIRYARVGEVTLLRVNDQWRIDSYDMVTKRDTVPPPQATTTTGGQEQ